MAISNDRLSEQLFGDGPSRINRENNEQTTVIGPARSRRSTLARWSLLCFRPDEIHRSVGADRVSSSVRSVLAWTPSLRSPTRYGAGSAAVVQR